MSHPDTRRSAAERPDSTVRSDDARIQSWFTTMLASLVPAFLSFVLPEAFRVAFFGAAGLLFAAGCVMLYRHDTQSS